jgi:UDPglucose 6-dehydrogenase
MDPVSAEMTKYACNAFLATRISFMNELAVLCEKLGGDIEKIRSGMATDVRIGKHFLYAGVGYGGSCFPKDVQALLATGRKANLPMGIIHATEEANARQKKHLLSRIDEYFKGASLKGKTIAIWGLAFKPNTDDMREAPSLEIIKGLLDRGARVQAFDPVATETAHKELGDSITYCKSNYSALEGADVLVIVTEWNEFRNPDFNKMKSLLRSPAVFDGRNLYSPEKMRSQGFYYVSIGRP